MNTKIFAVILLSFIVGALSATAYNIAANPAQELPSSLFSPQEQFSPSDTITEDHIKVYKNGVFVDLHNGEDEWLINLNLNNPSWSTFLDTNSMDPVIDKGANTIRIEVPCEEIKVGDIVSYQHEQSIIIHRVVHQDQDEQGPYFVLKGDNNPTNDPGKVRCEQILGKVVAIFY